MKLQMKNQLTFQEKSGYPDDPCPVTEGDVKEQLMYWHDLLVKADEERSLHPDLVNLEAFLYSLADGKVEYTDPAHEYKFVAGYEYNKRISVFAYSQDEADRKALAEFNDIAVSAPPTIGLVDNEARFSFKYLERDENHDWQRIYEG